MYPRGTDSARVIMVIETKTAIGDGTEENPVREVTQYWAPNGKRLAESDPFISEKQKQQQLQQQDSHR